MKTAIDETERRRAKQIQYNLEHGITPKGLNKKVSDILEDSPCAAKTTRPGNHKKVAQNTAEYNTQKPMTPAEMASHIKQVEKQMYKAAKELDFETAAHLRDELKSLKSNMVGIGDLR